MMKLEMVEHLSDTKTDGNMRGDDVENDTNP